MQTHLICRTKIQQNLLLARDTQRNVQRSWKPQRTKIKQINLPKPPQRGEESLKVAAQILGREALSVGKDIAKGSAFPALALLYVLANSGCYEKPLLSPWFTIDPAKECSNYPPGELLKDLNIVYVNGTPELPGERTKLMEIIGSIDYRFTEGVTTIQIEECEDVCKIEDRKIKGGYLYTKILLFRTADGSGGAFDNDFTLNWVIHHEFGHNVQFKIGEKLSEFHTFFKPIAERKFPTFSGYEIEWTEYDMNESFANYFARYILAGPYFRLLAEMPEDIKSDYLSYKYEDLQTDISIYDWFKTNIFCGKEYNKILDYHQLRIADIYLKKRDYNRAIEEYQKIIQNFSDNLYYVQRAYFGIGEAYWNLGEFENAIKAYEKVTEIHSEWVNGPCKAQFKIAQIYNLDLRNYESAIIEYQKLVDQYPNCDQAPSSLFTMGGIYRFLNEYENAISVLQKIIDNYPDYPSLNWVIYYLGETYYYKDDCPNAVNILQRLISEYPDFTYMDGVQQIIDACNNITS